MANVLERFVSRRRASVARKKVAREYRDTLDRVVAESFVLSGGDEEQAATIAEARMREMGLSLDTILMLMQVAMLIYQALKLLNVLSPTPQVIAAIFEEDTDA